VLDLDQDPSATPILVGREQVGLQPFAPNAPRAQAGPCRCDQ